ncbi:DUF4260 family protein [Haloarchaeobius sp. HRN-SO-5]|uniref:DUF4260 family protein n=1 Tax=Haloarchaeobius sp. HRN-SO-5 TaxID=3446118 RepID=UPI003EBDE161
MSSWQKYCSKDALLAGPRIGSYGYNLVHTYVSPLALAGVGLWLTTPLAVLVALVWAAHIGADRLVGYGLKYPTGFNDTHLDESGTVPSNDPSTHHPTAAR